VDSVVEPEAERLIRDFKDLPETDPYAEYARMRTKCPVQRVLRASGLKPYLITRYGDAKAALADPRLSKNPHYAEREITEAGLAYFLLTSGTGLSDNMGVADPPEHTRLRKLVSAEFTTRRVQGLRPRIQEITDQLIDAFADRAEADLMHEFAAQLPALVIAELLGLPSEDHEQFRTWAFESQRPPQDPRQAAALLALNQYVAGNLRRKRIEPAGDLLSALITSNDEDRLSDEELLGNAVLLLITGHETTVNLIGNGMLALLENPDQLDLLRRRPELIPEAVEELLRYDGPVERASTRYATEDIEIAGTVIPGGSIVVVALNSANRDPDAFPEPDTLDVTRSARGHLAFGHGIHFCPAAGLARLEAEIAFETLLRRLPTIELAVPATEVEYTPSNMMRSLESLPVRFTSKDPSSGGNRMSPEPARSAELTAAQREDLLRKSWMANDGLWFYQTAKAGGIDAANEANTEVVREFGRQEMARLMRALGIRKVETIEQYRQLYQAAVDLFLGALVVADESLDGDTHQLDITTCFAYKAVKRAGIDKAYHCGPGERLTGWLHAMDLPAEIVPAVGLCQMAHTGSCSYRVKLGLPSGTRPPST
jgi:cytochrome P450